MGEIVAYSTLALTMTLAVSRPRVGVRDLRFTPGVAALAGATVLLLAGLLRLDLARPQAVAPRTTTICAARRVARAGDNGEAVLARVRCEPAPVVPSRGRRACAKTLPRGRVR